MTVPARLAFARAGLRNPWQVGTVVRTSPATAAAMLDLAAPEIRAAALLADLGAGDGALTGPLLDRAPAAAQVTACEIDPALAAALTTRFAGDARLTVDTRDAAAVLAGLAEAGVIVSALPLKAIRARDRRAYHAVLIGAARALAPGGVLLQLQYTRACERDFRSWFGTVTRTRAWAGFPRRGFPWPYLYACRDPR